MPTVGSELPRLRDVPFCWRTTAMKYVNPARIWELKGTQVMVIPLEEAPAKVRTGPPLDAAKDYALDIWAGVLPLRLEPQAPVPDPRLGAAIPVPEHVRRYTPRSNKSPA